MKTRIAWRIAAAAVAVGTLFGLSACGNANNTGSSAASGSIIFGGDAVTGGFTQADFNPFDTANHRQGVNFLYEPLMVVNTMDGTATPFLATSNKIVDSKTIEYTIRQGVKWSDGKDFTPADVVFTFNLLKQNPALDSNGEWQHIDSIDVQGNTVTFHLKSPDVPAANVIDNQFIVPEHIWSKISDPGKAVNSKPVATGPYTLASFNANQYVLKKNPTYWDAAKVAVQTINVPSSGSQQDIVSKGFDWAYSYINDVQSTWVKAAAGKGKNTYWFPAGGIISLLPNLTKAPFNNVNFRQGLSLALDREQVAQDAELGYVKGAVQTGLMPTFSSWQNPDIADGGNVKQDDAAALAAFKKAGYTQKGGKLVDASGKQVSFSITLPNGYADWLRGVQTMQKEYQKLGINVTLNQPQQAAYNTAQQNGDFDLLVSSVGGTGNLWQDYNTYLNSSFYTPAGKQAAANFERYKDPATDAILNQLKGATTEDQQKPLVAKLQSVVYDQLPVISVFYGGLWGLYSNKTFTGWPSADNPYASPATWTNQNLMVVTHLKKA